MILKLSKKFPFLLPQMMRVTFTQGTFHAWIIFSFCVWIFSDIKRHLLLFCSRPHFNDVFLDPSVWLRKRHKSLTLKEQKQRKCTAFIIKEKQILCMSKSQSSSSSWILSCRLQHGIWWKSRNVCFVISEKIAISSFV